MNTKEQAKHTPGPWKLFKTSFGNEQNKQYWGVGKNNSLMQIYYFEKYGDAKRKYLELARPEWEAAEKKKKALQEAAPELLEAAKAALLLFDARSIVTNAEKDQRINTLASVIEKAEGRP